MKKMNKNMILSALLMAIGFVLHAVVPGFLGMKFDFLVTFMIISIIITPDLKSALMCGVLGGFMTALTTTFPGGQIANMVDKIVTALVVCGLVRVMPQKMYTSLFLGLVGTLVSGIVFLTVAFMIAPLPSSLMSLIYTVVIPTSAANAAMTFICDRAAKIALRSVRSFSK